MTIGIVMTSVPGYSETFFRSKIQGLQAQGFEVLLFVDSQRNTIDFPCKVIFAPDLGSNIFKTVFNGMIAFLKVMFFTPKKSLRLYQLDKADGIPFKRRFKNMILNQFFLPYNLDWLHFAYGILAYRRENVAKVIGAKMAVSFRGFDLYLSPLKHNGCYTLLFQKKVQYHVLSVGMSKRLLNFGIDKKHIHVITPAIDVNYFSIDVNSAQKTNTKINIVTIARLHWIKGLEYTLEALKILKENDIQFTYTVIGDGDQYERLIFATHQLGLSGYVNFIGKLSAIEVRHQLEQSNIYLQYSIQEGFCNATLEAQSMGLLCIVSNAEGLTQNVLNNITGWVVPKRNPELLSEKIMEVIHLPHEEKKRIILNARKRVKYDFNLELQHKAFKDFYL